MRTVKYDDIVQNVKIFLMAKIVEIVKKNYEIGHQVSWEQKEKILRKTFVQINTEMVSNWFRQSGHKVNETIMEVCIFHRKDKAQVLDNTNIRTIRPMNKWGVKLDSKLSAAQ